MRLVIVFVACCLCSSVQAQSVVDEQRCANARSTADQSDCIQHQLNAAEAEMNRVFRSVIAQYLPTAENEQDIRTWSKRDQKLARQANKRTARSYETSQKKWFEYREAACKAVEESYQGGTAAAVAAPSCKLDLTRERIEWLNGNLWAQRTDKSSK